MRSFLLLCSALVIGISAAAMAEDPPSEIQSLQIGPDPGNAADNASEIETSLRNAGFTDVEKTSCSGSICESQARWKGKPLSLSIELGTGRVQTTELPQ